MKSRKAVNVHPHHCITSATNSRPDRLRLEVRPQFVMSDETRTKCTIHVTGLDPATTSAALHEFFLPFGEIVDIHLPLDKATQTARGFAHVEFSESGDADAAIDNADQAELFGKVVRVSRAKAPVNAGRDGRVVEGLGSRVAVWEQEGWLKRHEVAEEDRLAVEEAGEKKEEGKGAGDPMEGLEGLDVAGPKMRA
ncbi:hypothetical protein Dda_7855 [Drechslerella dactyloides]|uniref:RRM domain-containing protein n=1 Tax=Drechslerella dactyloides TaxID=74499 RepID=A0AAD6NG87_DREDA|nr:hypothetical protein Dda_7855 [Drechslerella dactyloides]